MPATCRVIALLSIVLCAAEAGPSPVQRIINMLQVMQKQVQKEDQQQAELFDEYMCAARQNLDRLNGDIEMGKTTVPQLESAIKEASAEKAALENDIADAEEEHAEAKKTMDEATKMRNKENSDYKDKDRQMKADIEALKKANAAMAKLDEGSFLQADMTANIRRLVAKSSSLSSADRDVITNFLSESENDQDQSDGLSASSPAEITGILKQMQENMEKELVQLNEDEDKAQRQYESLKSAKESQMSTLQSQIQSKTERLGQVEVQIVEDKRKLQETNVALEANTKMYDNLSKESKARQNEYNLETKTRQEELGAIADTIVILNDDTAHELFKRTFPTAASLLQLQVSPKELRSEALETLKTAMPKGKTDPRLQFVALAVKSKKVSFTKVLQMIDDMVTLLNKEQKDDEDKKKYCKSEIATTEDEIKELDYHISDLEKEIDADAQKSKSLSDDLQSKTNSIQALDQQVAEMTKLRKEEHQDFSENLHANNNAKEILGVAKARLSKFYSKQTALPQKLLQTKDKSNKPAHGKEQIVGQALRIKGLRQVQQGKQKQEVGVKGEAEALFGAFSFVQVNAQSASKARAKLFADGNKVLNLITTIMDDLDKEIKEMTQDEETSQMDYENAMKDAAEKRAGDAKAVTELEGFKAEVEAELHKMTKSHTNKNKERDQKKVYLEDMHKECDWLLEHFDTRRAARSGETDALKKAKAVLEGVDPAGFLQISMRKSLRVVGRRA